MACTVSVSCAESWQVKQSWTRFLLLLLLSSNYFLCMVIEAVADVFCCVVKLFPRHSNAYTVHPCCGLHPISNDSHTAALMFYTIWPVTTNWNSCPCGLAFMWWGCCGLHQRHKPTELATPFQSVLMFISVFMAFSTVFHSIKSYSNSPLSHSVLPVLILLIGPFNYRSLY